MSARDQVTQLLELAGDGVVPIVQAGVPVLRRIADPYDGQLGDDLGLFLDLMRRTMQAAPGVGLAAPQIGVGLAIAVVQDAGDQDDEERERPPVPFRVLINPAYEPAGPQRVAFYEGCLSVRGWQAVRPRWRQVRLTGTDERGAALDEVLAGWPARIIQHETDHLRGELYLDGAELRSLADDRAMTRYWARPRGQHLAAQELGFQTPEA